MEMRWDEDIFEKAQEKQYQSLEVHLGVRRTESWRWSSCVLGKCATAGFVRRYEKGGAMTDARVGRQVAVKEEHTARASHLRPSPRPVKTGGSFEEV